MGASAPHLEPFRYQGFWDILRLIVVLRPTGDGTLVLLDSPFHEDLDEYDPEFHVLRIRPELEHDWKAGVVESLVVERLGTVPVEDVRFDPTRRALLDVETGRLGEMLRGVWG